MTKKTLHKHHIIPKHAGGTDEPDNLVLLTIEEHAEAHRILYEKYGRWQDRVAWEGLSKMIDQEEAISQSIKNADKTWMQTEWGKKRLREGWKKRKNNGYAPWNKGKNLQEDPCNQALIKLREANLKAREEGRLANIGEIMRGKPLDEEHKGKLSQAAKERSKYQCPHCGKEVTKQMLARWHGDKCSKKPTSQP